VTTASPLICAGDLTALLAQALDARRCVSLLILRWADLGSHGTDQLERAAISAFTNAARQIIRDGDVLAHDPGADWFAIAMMAPSRDGAWPAIPDARAVLERVAATISLSLGRRMETGWWAVTQTGETEDFHAMMKRALERGARERERYEFLATVGHELRTPLTSIRGYLETLLDSEIDPAAARHFLETARSEALRLGRIVDGMLDFSLLDLSVAGSTTAQSHVATMVEAAIQVLAPIASDAGIAIQFVHRDAGVARIDPDACMRALVNLVENGIKYGRRGGNVVVSTRPAGRYIRICIDDNGPGVAPEERESIFEHGVRGRAAQLGGGTGIGLSVVRAIVQRVAGSVHVERSPLGGARFVLRLPRVHEAELGPAVS
jgi:signal transduction histidine kinase